MNREICLNLVDKIFRLLIAVAVVLLLKVGIDKDIAKQTPDSGVVDITKIQTLFPNAHRVDEVAETVWSKVYDAKGQILGSYTLSHPYIKGVIGYAGEIPLIVGTDFNGQIVGVDLLDNQETRSFIRRVRQAGLLDSWNGKYVEQAAVLEVDAVSGATYSSDAIKETLVRRLAMLGDAEIVFVGGRPLGPKEMLAGAVLAAGLLFFIMGKKLSKYRWVFLLFSVVGAGFISGKMLSTEQIYSWIKMGLASYISVTFVIAAVAVVIAIFTNKNFYCNFYCPFGCSQELAGLLIKKKTRLPKIVSKNLPRLKRFILVALILLLVLRANIDLGKIEPFSAFLITSASWIVLVLAGVFLLLSVFFPRLWCRGFCPTGAIMDFFSRTRKCCKKERETK